MRRIGRRVERGNAQAAKSRDRVPLARRGSGLLVAGHQLVHRVDDRRVEVALVRAEHLERLIAVTQEWAKTPRQLDADECEQQRPRAHDGERRSEEHTSELQSLAYLVCRLLLEKKKKSENVIYALADGALAATPMVTPPHSTAAPPRLLPARRLVMLMKSYTNTVPVLW